MKSYNQFLKEEYKQIQFQYNIDKFESGENNILLICGYSGSGKSTLASQLSSQYDAEVFELDEPFYQKFLNKYTKKQFIEKLLWEFDDIRYEYYSFIMGQLPKLSKNKKYIIEGVWMLYNEDLYPALKQYSVIIVETSLIQASINAVVRAEDRFTSGKFSKMPPKEKVQHLLTYWRVVKNTFLSTLFFNKKGLSSYIKRLKKFLMESK